MSQYESVPEAAAGRWVAAILTLVYYFTLCDFLLKFVPFETALGLRYAPEFTLYALAIARFYTRRQRKTQRKTFPLLLPLFVFATTICITCALTGCPILKAGEDFRSYWRFAAFAYILWDTPLEGKHIRQLLNGILGLASVELLIAGCEVLGGQPVREFFAPALGWASGRPEIPHNLPMDTVGWLAGTLSNGNHFGTFMVLAWVTGISCYLYDRSARYLAITTASFAAVILSYSRHSVLSSVLAAFLLLWLSRFRALAMGAAAIALVVGLLFYQAAKDTSTSATVSTLGDRFTSAFTSAALGADPRENVRLYLALELPPRFLRSSPFFGEGPEARVPLSQGLLDSTESTYSFDSAGDLPAGFMIYLPDVVWVLILGLYGCCGVAAYAFVLLTICRFALRLRASNCSQQDRSLATICLIFLAIYVLTAFFSLTVVSRDTIPTFWLIVGAVLSRVRTTAPAPFRKSLCRFAAITATTAHDNSLLPHGQRAATHQLLQLRQPFVFDSGC